MQNALCLPARRHITRFAKAKADSITAGSSYVRDTVSYPHKNTYSPSGGDPPPCFKLKLSHAWSSCPNSFSCILLSCGSARILDNTLVHTWEIGLLPYFCALPHRNSPNPHRYYDHLREPAHWSRRCRACLRRSLWSHRRRLFRHPCQNGASCWFCSVLQGSDYSAATWSFNSSSWISLSKMSIFGVVLKNSMRAIEDYGKPHRSASVLWLMSRAVRRSIIEETMTTISSTLRRLSVSIDDIYLLS